MWSITLKLMKKSVRMLVPAGIAVMIGTAFIACTFLFGNTLDESLRSQFTAQLGQANYVIAADRKSSPTVADFHRADIHKVTGVRGLRPEAASTIELSRSDHHVSSIAVVTADDSAVLPVDIVSGTQPKAQDQVAIPRGLATQIKAGIGDVIELGTDTDDAVTPVSQQLRVVGLTKDTHGAYSYYGGASVVSETTMAMLYGVRGGFESVPATQLYLDIDPVHADTAMSAIHRILPRSFTIETSESISSKALESTNTSGMNPVTIFLLIFGVIAMFVAAMVIANTFQVLVMQRRRIFALLRTIGAKKGQIYRSVILESVLFGLMSSVLGVILGIAIMAVVCRIGAFGQVAPDAKLVLSMPVFVVPMVFGVIMTVLASLGSARAATRVTPLEALRPMEVAEGKGRGRMRTVFGLTCAVAGLACSGWSIYRMHDYLPNASRQGSAGYSSILYVAIAACLLVFIGLSVTAVSWLPRLMKGVGALCALAGPSAKVAHANIQKNPRRVGGTGLALLIGVTLVCTIGTGAASGRQTIDNELNTRYSVDLVITGTGLDGHSEQTLKKVDGIRSTLYAPYATGVVKDAHGTPVHTMLVGVPDVAALQAVVRTDLHGTSIGGSTALFQARSASTGKNLKFAQGKVHFESDATSSGSRGEGDSGPRSGDSRQLDLTVRQCDFRNFGVPYDAVGFVDTSRFNDGQLNGAQHILLAKVDTDSSGLAKVMNDVQSSLGGQSHVQVGGPIAERAQWESIIDVMMKLLIGLLAVAVLIALIGVANTLILSVIERTKESATLRAIGMTRRQLRRSLAIEALLIALVSGVVGVVLGTLFGWLGSYMVFSLFGKVALPIDWAMDGAVLVVAAIAALLASVAPARRALRTSPVEALAEV